MLKFALVGCGGMANGWHAPTMLKNSAEARVVALCDIVKEKTADFRQRHFKDAAEFTDFYEMIEKVELDAVLLVTPHTVHYPHALAALKKGINVACEKPLVTSSEHAYSLWQAVKQSGKLLAITYQSPYTAEFGHLAQLRDAGKLGKVQNISGYLSQNWCKGCKGLWRQDPKFSGGGFIYDSGAHMLNAIMWLMNDPVVEVSCIMDNCGTPVDIRASAALRFQNDTFASVTMAGNTAPFRTEIQIFTDTMVIITDQYGGKLEMYRADGKRMYPHVPEYTDPAAGTPHHNFIQALLGREPLRAPVRYGVLLSALMDAMYESSAKKAPVAVKPVPPDIDVAAAKAKRAGKTANAVASKR